MTRKLLVSPFAEASGDKSPPPVARGATGGGGGKRVRKYPLSILTCHSRVGGNDKSGVGLGTYSPLSSRAKRGDPVNKKALRANARRHQ